MADDFRDDIRVGDNAQLPLGGTIYGSIETLGDIDVFKISVIIGFSYSISCYTATQMLPILGLFNAAGANTGTWYTRRWVGLGVVTEILNWTATESGDFYVAVSADAASSIRTGNYNLYFTEASSASPPLIEPPDDLPEDTPTVDPPPVPSDPRYLNWVAANVPPVEPPAVVVTNAILTGTTKDWSGNPLSCVVAGHKRSDFSKEDATVSSAVDGSYSLDLETNTEYFITAASQEYGLVEIKDRVTVELSIGWEFDLLNYDDFYSEPESGDNVNAIAGYWLDETGTYLFAATTSGYEVLKWTLATPFKVSTATYNGKALTGRGSLGNTGRSGLCFSQNGEHMYISTDEGLSDEIIYGFDLSTPWDLSSAVEQSGYVYHRYVDYPNELHISPDGLNFYVSDYGQQQFKLDVAWQLGVDNDFDAYVSEWGPTATYQLKSSNIVPDGSGAYFMYNVSSYDYVRFVPFTTPWDQTVRGTEITCNVPGPGKILGLYLNSIGTAGIVRNEGGWFSFTLSTPYDLTTLVSDRDNLPGQTGTGAIYYAVTFNPSGTILYTFGSNSPYDVHQYTLSTPFDITTATFVYTLVGKSLYGIWGALISHDGLKLFMHDGYENVYVINLAVAWDLSSYVDTDRVNDRNGNDDIHGMAFNDDGTKVYYKNGWGDDINEYSLSPAYDITSEVFVSSLTLPTTYGDVYAPLSFNASGTALYVVAQDNGRKYALYISLSTAYDLSTAAFVEATEILAMSNSDYDRINFSFDGMHMYTSDHSNTVYQINIEQT